MRAGARRQPARAASLVCDAPAVGGRRPALDSRAVGPRAIVDDANLHAGLCRATDAGLRQGPPEGVTRRRGEGIRMIAGFDGEEYRIAEIAEVMTPALAIYPELVDANIQTTLRLAGGDANRLRPHVKTAKLVSVMRQWTARGIVNFKCSTSLELLTVCEAGAKDALLAYP